MRFLAILSTLLFAGSAFATPVVQPTSGGRDWFAYTVTFDDSLADSVAFGASGLCSVGFIYGGSGTVQLYQVPTADTAASAGTQVGADFTATLSEARSVTPGQPFFKAVATVASSGSVLRIQCTNTQLSRSGSGTGGDLDETITSTQVTITNTGGTDAVIPSATDSAAGVLPAADKAKLDAIVFIDPLQYDGACTGCGVDDANITVSGTLDLFDRLREAITACPDTGGGFDNIKYGCELVLPAGEYDVDTSLSLWGSPSDSVTNTGMNGITIRGAGDGVVRTSGAGGSGTHINWVGANGAAWMLNLHGAKHVKVEGISFNTDGDQVGDTSGYKDGLNVAAVGIALTSDATNGEPSIGNRFENITISSRALTRVIDNGGNDSTCFDISEEGDGTYSGDSQVDHTVFKDSWLECHTGVFLGQGPSGSTMFDNVVVNYARKGYDVNDSDVQIRGGYANTWSDTSTGATAEDNANEAMCDAVDAFIKLGNSTDVSTGQPPSISVTSHRLEANCGSGLVTVQGATPANTRDSSTVLNGIEWSFGDLVGTEYAIDYRHDGTLSISGTIGLRNGGDTARTAAIPINIQPANELNYYLDVNHVHNPSIIALTVAAKARPQAEDQTTNVALDRDRDGLPDFVHLTGDYNRDGTTDSEDIQAAFDALTDANPRVLVDGIFDNSYIGNEAIPWDTTDFVLLPSGATLECTPNSKIIGPEAAFWIGRVANAYQIRSDPDATGVTVRGCTIDNPELYAPHDGDTYLTGLFPGIYFDNCSDCLAEGNTVLGSVHSAFFMVNGQGTRFIGNTSYASGGIFNHEGNATTLAASESAGDQSIDLTALPTNCDVLDPILIELDSGDWDLAWVEVDADPMTIRRAAFGSGRNPGLSGDATSGNAVFCSEGSKHGFETYANTHIIAANNVISGNTARLTAGTSFYIRGVSNEEDTEAASCEDDTQVDCWHENVEVSYNSSIDGGGDLLGIRGARNGLVTGNSGIRTGGILFVKADDFCSAAFDDGAEGVDTATQLECTDSMVVTNNIVRDGAPNVGGSSVGGTFRINNGHENLTFTGNLLDGNIGGHGYAITGNVRNSTVEVLGRWIAGKGFIDGLNAAGTSPITVPLAVSGKLTNVGMSIAPGSTLQAIDLLSENTALDFKNFDMNGTAGMVRVFAPNLSGTTKMPEFRNFSLNFTRSGYMGTGTVAEMNSAISCDGSVLNRWFLVTDGTGATDCATGGASTENRCYCNGSAMTDMSLLADTDAVSVTAGSGETVENGGFFNGTFINTPSNGRWFLTSTGTGTTTGMTVENVGFFKGPGALTADLVYGMREISEGLTDFTVTGARFDSSISSANLTLGIEQADYSGDSIFKDTDAAAGACSSGAIYMDLDASASGALSYCRNSVWVSLD